MAVRKRRKSKKKLRIVVKWDEWKVRQKKRIRKT